METFDGAKRGRPSGYTAEIATTICERLAYGESLRAICADAGMPNKATVFRWIGRHREFRDQYVLAHEVQADLSFDEILKIADDASKDFVEVTTADGTVSKRVDYDHIQRSKLRVDARKWAAARLAPKKYGERIAQQHEGAPAIAPRAIIIFERDDAGTAKFGKPVPTGNVISRPARARARARVMGSY